MAKYIYCAGGGNAWTDVFTDRDRRRAVQNQMQRNRVKPSSNPVKTVQVGCGQCNELVSVYSFKPKSSSMGLFSTISDYRWKSVNIRQVGKLWTKGQFINTAMRQVYKNCFGDATDSDTGLWSDDPGRWKVFKVTQQSITTTHHLDGCGPQCCNEYKAPATTLTEINILRNYQEWAVKLYAKWWTIVIVIPQGPM